MAPRATMTMSLGFSVCGGLLGDQWISGRVEHSLSTLVLMSAICSMRRPEPGSSLMASRKVKPVRMSARLFRAVVGYVMVCVLDWVGAVRAAPRSCESSLWLKVALESCYSIILAILRLCFEVVNGFRCSSAATVLRGFRVKCHFVL